MAPKSSKAPPKKVTKVRRGADKRKHLGQKRVGALASQANPVNRAAMPLPEMKAYRGHYVQLPAPSEIVSVKDAARRGRVPMLENIDPGTYSLMLECVRQGAFDHVAAGCIGIVPHTFKRWQTRGRVNYEAFREGEAKLDLYGQFYRDLWEARCKARGHAEFKVFKRDPLSYLKFGPGKTTKELEGWTDKQAVEISGPDGGPVELDVVSQPDKSTAVMGALAELAKLGALQMLLEKQGIVLEESQHTNGDNGNGR